LGIGLFYWLERSAKAFALHATMERDGSMERNGSMERDASCPAEAAKAEAERSMASRTSSCPDR
jgi:hypothetical protein